MKKSCVSLVVFLVGILATAVLYAAEFSADAVHKFEGAREKVTKMYMGKNKIRNEGMGEGNYMIVRMDLKKSWVVMPSKKAYMEMKANLQNIPQTEEKVKGEISRKLVGSESVNGHPTKKYEVTYKDGTKTIRSYQWIATDLNFPIRMADANGKWVTEYRNIKTGSQPDSLFEIPAGYKKLSIPGMSGMKMK
jgi:hypothetical protein